MFCGINDLVVSLSWHALCICLRIRRRAGTNGKGQKMGLSDAQKAQAKRLIDVSIKAHRCGLATECKAGKIRFVTVVYDAKGNSTVTPHTEWLTADEAEPLIDC